MAAASANLGCSKNGNGITGPIMYVGGTIFRCNLLAKGAMTMFGFSRTKALKKKKECFAYGAMGPLALWVPAEDDAGPPQPWMEDTHRGRVGHRQTTLGAWTWPRFRAEHPWDFTNPAQAFVSLRFVPFRSFRSVSFISFRAEVPRLTFKVTITCVTSHKVHIRVTITCDDYLKDLEAPLGGVPPPNVFGFIGFAHSVKARSSFICS